MMRGGICRPLKNAGLFLFCLMSVSAAVAQKKGGIAGLVSDAKTGRELVGITVIVQGSMAGDATDVEGRYLIKGLDSGMYTLQFSSVVHKELIIREIEVVPGEITIINAEMTDSIPSMRGVVVTTRRAKKETVLGMTFERKNMASISDNISAEQIKRTPDRTTAEAIRRVPGASIQDRSFVIMRGLNERYNLAYLNGSPLVSSDPDRKGFPFDLIPANQIDNIVVQKTATPELPADFAGGVINVNTRDIPDESFQSLMVGFNFNTASTLQNGQFQQGGSLDFLGIDDKSRSLPDGLPDSYDYKKLSKNERIRLSRSFNNDWAIRSSSVQPGYYFQYSVAKKFKMGNADGATIFALSYNSTNRYVLGNRNEVDSADKGFNVKDDNYYKTVLLGGIFNFSIRFNKLNKLSWKNSYNISTLNQTQIRQGYNKYDSSFENTNGYYYYENHFYSSQLQGDHSSASKRLKFKWLGSFTNLDRETPSYRRLMYKDKTGTSVASIGRTADFFNAGRFYSDLNENTVFGSYQFSFISYLNESKIDFRLGGYHLARNRNFSSRTLGYAYDSAAARNLFTLPAEQLLDPSNMKSTGLRLDDISLPTDNYEGTAFTHAGYAMMDNILFRKFRIVWGARYEKFDMKLTSRDLNNRRVDSIWANTLILPSANIIYSLNAKTHLRLAAGKTVTRPDYREVAQFRYYDFNQFATIQGNPSLKTGTVMNYDARLEIYPGEGQSWSFTYFRKEFTNPIELVMTNTSNLENRQLTYRNAESAELAGAEIEFRQKLEKVFHAWKGASVFGNLSVIGSKVTRKGISEQRALQGQSPYIINCGFQYNRSGSGWGGTLLLNRIGQRINTVGTANYADIYEKARTVFDLQISKNFGKKAELRFTWQDLLGQKIILYQNLDEKTSFDESKDYLVSDAIPGTTVQVTYLFRF